MILTKWHCKDTHAEGAPWPSFLKTSSRKTLAHSNSVENHPKDLLICVEPGGEAPKRPEKPKETLAENGRETPFPPLLAAGSTINKGRLATAHEPARRLTKPKRRLTNPHARAASRTRAQKPAQRLSTPGRTRRRVTNPLQEPAGRRKTPDRRRTNPRAASRTPAHEPARRLTNPRAPRRFQKKRRRLSRTPSNEIRAAVTASRKGLTDSLARPSTTLSNDVRGPLAGASLTPRTDPAGPRKKDRKSSQGLPRNGQSTAIAAPKRPH